MKGLTLLLLLVAPYWSYPQGVFANNTQSTLEAVLNDYPNHFKNIKGQRLNDDPQSTDFTSKVEIPGTVNTVITQYSSSGAKEVLSWRTTVLETDEFPVASDKYKEVFKQLSNSIIKITGQKPFILSGSYVAPSEEKRFNSSSLHLLPAANGELGKVKVELTMEFLVTEWKIALLVYDEDEESLVMD